MSESMAARGPGVRAGAGARAAYRGGRRLAFALLERWLLLALLILIWELYTRQAQSVYFPPPTEIVSRAYEKWLSGPATSLFVTAEARADVIPSLLRLSVGWGIAAVVGVTVGIAIGVRRSTADYVHPLIDFLRSIPPPAIIPVFLIVLGASFTMRVALISFGSVWPILLNSMDGARSTDALQLQTARVFKLSRRKVLFGIVIPSAAPAIAAGMRVSLALALLLMVTSEYLGSDSGIGFDLLQAQRSFAIVDMWAGMLLLGLLGYLINAAFLLLEGRALAWHRGARGREN